MAFAKQNKNPNVTLCTHVPWAGTAYACRDCQISEVSEVLFNRFHSRHRKFDSETNMSVWFLLVNGLLLFIGKGLGLDTLGDLLLYVVDHGLHSRDYMTKIMTKL